MYMKQNVKQARKLKESRSVLGNPDERKTAGALMQLAFEPKRATIHRQEMKHSPKIKIISDEEK